MNPKSKIAAFFVWTAISLQVIGQAPVILEHPQSVAAAVENDVYLAASAESFLAYSRVWLKDGVPVSDVGSLKVTESGRYSLLASNACGVAVSAEAAVSIKQEAPPFIYVQPQDINPPQTTADLRVFVYGSLPLYFQWRKDGIDLPDETDSIIRWHNPATGLYSVVISNAFGSVTSRVATVTVEPTIAPVVSIVFQPVSQTVTNGTDVKFSVGIQTSGDGLARFQWQKEGIPLVGQTNSSLLIEKVTETDVGIYSVVVYGGGSQSVASRSAALTVIPLVAPTYRDKAFSTVIGPFPTISAATVRSGVIRFAGYVAEGPFQVFMEVRDGQTRFLTDTNTLFEGRAFRPRSIKYLSYDLDGTMLFLADSMLIEMDEAGILRRMLPLDTPVPGQENLRFTRFGQGIRRQGVAVFFGYSGVPERAGLYRWDGERLTTIADRSTSLPECGGTFVFDGLHSGFTGQDSFDFDGESVAFTASSTARRTGIFASFKGGPLVTIAVRGDSAERPDLRFDTFSAPAIRGREVAFYTSAFSGPYRLNQSDVELVVLYGDEGRKIIAETRRQSPREKPPKIPAPGQVLFSSSRNLPGTGLFLWDGEKINPVIGPLNPWSTRGISVAEVMDVEGEDILALIWDKFSQQSLASTVTIEAKHPLLMHSQSDAGLTLQWSGDFVLQVSTNLSEWHDFQGGPPIVTRPDAERVFYRLRGAAP